MKRKVIAGLLVVAALAIIWPVLRNNPVQIWSFDAKGPFRYSMEEAQAISKTLLAQMEKAKRQGHYSVATALEIDTQADFISWYANDPDKDDFTMVASEGGSKFYWMSEGVHWKSNELMAELMSPAEKQEYDRLYLQHLQKDFNLRPFTDREYSEWVASPRLFGAGMLLLIIAVMYVGPVLMRLGQAIPREALVCGGWFLALTVSLLTGIPATAQILIEKAKKDTQHIEEVKDNTSPDPLPASPPPHLFELKSESWRDLDHKNGHEFQNVTSVFLRFRQRLSLAFINQFRQDLPTGQALDTPTLGLRVNLAPGLTVTATSGPEFDRTKPGAKYQLKKDTTFLVLGYKAPAGSWKPSFTLLNRFPRELDAPVTDTHRHIAAIRAGPLPLAYQAEVKWSKGNVVENFHGIMLYAGQKLREGRLKRWLGGAYVYPYYDFKTSWNVRIGLTESFTF